MNEVLKEKAVLKGKAIIDFLVNQWRVLNYLLSEEYTREVMQDVLTKEAKQIGEMILNFPGQEPLNLPVRFFDINSGLVDLLEDTGGSKAVRGLEFMGFRYIVVPTIFNIVSNPKQPPYLMTGSTIAYAEALLTGFPGLTWNFSSKFSAKMRK